jgi:signal transduction histidine kinase
VDRRLPGIEGTARLLPRRAVAAGRPVVVVVGTSLQDRHETLRSVITSFLIGGTAALLLASAIGYGLATAGLAPVEAMRRRASRVSFDQADERLPLPESHDEVRRLGETLNEMLARLQESFERERRFVADASHELRTPIAVLKTELETALRNPGIDEDVRASLAAGVEEADHLAHLAEDLLLIARAADGRLPVRLEPVSLAELLERGRERFVDRARERGREIAVEADEGLAADLDPVRMRQALGNLVDNALRHGGGDIELSARQRDGAVDVEVSDGGPGLSPELAERAFERFARGEATRSRGGAGLGLAIVKAIAEAHGGTAEIVGQDGPGTTIRLRLPDSQPALSTDAQGQPGQTPEGGSP